MLRVKIVCTIGPASRELDILTQVVEAGMNVARLNMSHGTHDYHRGTIERIRAVSKKLGKPVAILADLQGPKLRVGIMQEGGVPLERNDELVMTTEEIVGQPGRVPVQFKKLPETVKPSHRILLDDGMLELEVLEVNGCDIRTRVVHGGVLHDNKGINLPDGSLTISPITTKDRDDVKFALENQVDWIALSFVRAADEVHELKSLIQDMAPFGHPTPVISKIEKPEAVENIDSIIEASDGIMVARGDLGIETSPEIVPTIQKLLISKCHQKACPVITATQMLDSMIRNPRPTRAEASDVANAVLDGSDAIMLSGETASGKFPVEAVQTMARIASEAERIREDTSLHLRYLEPAVFTDSGAVCHAAISTAKEVGAKAIVAPTSTGATARLIAAFRPEHPVVAVTPSPRVQRRLCLYWGVYPLLTKRLRNTDRVVDDALEITLEHGFAGEGDTLVLTAGMVGSTRSATNLMMVRTIERVLARGTGVGQQEVVGRVRRITLPTSGDMELGAQDIAVGKHIDHSCMGIIRHAKGIITGESDIDNPAVIVAVDLGTPAIISVGDDIDNLKDGDMIVMDTANGRVVQWDK